MQIFPSINIQHGKVVRLRGGDFNQAVVYAETPAQTAKRYVDAGLKRIHVTDLDGVLVGIVKNWKSIEELLKIKDIKLLVGGGVRSREDIDRLLELGAERVILGSIALTLPNLIKAWIQSVGARRIAIAVDVKNNKLAVGGWMEEFEKSPNLFLMEMNGFGAKTFICTDVEREGSLEGPNLEWYREVRKFFKEVDLVASGGIRAISDLHALADLGVNGAVIGKALHEGSIKLEELQKFVEASPG
jgi:phosphoribosylformimino-5-aminoimidazole carboxamide ribotide isomerase